MTRRPLWIRSLGRALDADETLLQLAYYEASNNKAPRFEWVSQLQISDRRQLVQLARSGAPVRTGNADRVEEYLDRAHVENGASLPRVLMAKRSGAYEIDDKWGWLIGSHWIGPPGIDVERDPREEPGMTKGFVVSGDEHEPQPAPTIATIIQPTMDAFCLPFLKSSDVQLKSTVELTT